MNTYGIGTAVQLSGSFITPAGVYVDPTTVSCEITFPNGYVQTISGGSITRIALGQYQVDFTGPSAGIFKYRWVGTGAVLASNVPVAIQFL